MACKILSVNAAVVDKQLLISISISFLWIYKDSWAKWISSGWIK